MATIDITLYQLGIAGSFGVSLNVNLGRWETICLLVKQGANVNVNAGGVPPLIIACQGSADPETVGLLLQHGANVNTRSLDGRTALYWAVHSAISGAKASAACQLLAHGANPNLPDNDGDTPLKLAQWYNRHDLIGLLKHYGARDTGKRP